MALTKPRASQIYDIDYKQATRVITTTNINLNGGAPSQVDGVNLSLDDRVLVIGQNTGSQNGIYFVDAVGTGSNGTWIRSGDTNTTGELLSGTIVMVTEGLIYADTQWKLTTDNPIVIGTTALAFEQNSAFAFGNVYANNTAVLATTVGDSLTLTAGNNISITGNNTSKTVSIGVTGISLNSISNGTSNVNVVSPDGNVTVGVAGTSNVAVFSSDGATITGHVLPSADITYDLGSPTQRWRSMYVGANTIDIGGATISANLSAGSLVLTGPDGAEFLLTGTNTLNAVGHFGMIEISNAMSSHDTASGALTVVGGAGIGGNINVGGVANVTGNITGGNIIGGNILGNGYNLTGINSFSTISVTSGNSTVANSIDDTLTLTAGSGIVLIANSVSKTITFSTGGTGVSIFATGGDMELITDLVTDSLDLGLVTELVTENNDLGGFYIEGFVSNDNFLPGTIYGNILLANAVISTTGNITAGYFIGNGSQLTGVTASLAGNLDGNIEGNGFGANSLSFVSTTGNITGDNLITTGAVYSNFNTNTANTASFNATGGNTKGGTGYLDFLVARNTSSGATNPYKWLRLNSTGGLEIINSAYSATLLTLTDAGAFSVASTVSATGFNVNNKQAVNGPAFSAYASSGTTIPTDVLTKVNFQTEEYDTNSNFASSRFTPTVEGYYQLNSTVRISGSSGTGEMMIVLYKNGAEYHRGWNSQGVQIGSGWWSMSVSSTAYANGTGDYFEIYVQQGSAANRDTTSGTTITWFNGCMLRGA